MKKNRCPIGFMFMTVAILFVAVPNPSNANQPLAEFDALVERWMMLRTTIAGEQREWNARREQWNTEIELLEHEAETLGKEIEETRLFSSSTEKKRAKALAAKQKMEAELDNLVMILDESESDLRKWKNRIPESLKTSIATGFKALPATQKEADSLPIIKRAKTVAVLYSQIETIQNQIHSTSEMLDVDGTRRQLDVLYVGLARGFAVSPKNDWAAVGMPSDNGWIWIPAAKDAHLVRRAIDVANRQEIAQLVALPMQVATDGKP